MARKIIDYNEHIKRTQIGKKSRRKSRGNFTLIYIALIFIILTVFFALSLTVFFNIKDFDVSGTDLYSPEEVIKSTGLEGNENLIRLDKAEIANRLKAKLLYIEDVKVIAEYPATLKIEITQAVPFAAIEDNGDYYVISDTGKILEKKDNAEIPAGLIKLTGAILPEKSLEDYEYSLEIPKISFAEERTGQAYFELIENLSLYSVGSVTQIMIKDYLSISFVLEERIRVNMGSSVDIPYKMKYVEKILEEKKDETRYLLINVSSTEKATVRTLMTYEELWS